MSKLNILLTTPDAPPKLGGLSTFTAGIHQILNDTGHNIEMKQWDYSHQLQVDSSKYDYIFNIQFRACDSMKRVDNVINFIHGSEISFSSANPVKKFVKQMIKKKWINCLESSKNNIFISEFTYNHLISQGFTANYSRDIIFHNCIDTKDHSFKTGKNLKKELKLICVARDVPHKNFQAVVNLALSLANIMDKKVTLYLTSSRFKSNKIDIVNIKGRTDEEIRTLYSECHFNLLLSQDHSSKGFFEGFGLTCLEAGLFGTPSLVYHSGGLPENVHHKFNGWCFSDLSKKGINEFLEFLTEESYAQLSKNTYQHTLSSHTLELYKRLFNKIWDL